MIIKVLSQLTNLTQIHLLDFWRSIFQGKKSQFTVKAESKIPAVPHKILLEVIYRVIIGPGSKSTEPGLYPKTELSA